MSRDVLVTAGTTRNPVDAMRYIGAYSSGKTGATLAKLLAQTSRVHVLGSPEACLRLDVSISRQTFGSTRDLMTRMEEWVADHPGGTVVHAAAVGDYEVEPNREKIASGQDEVVLRLSRSPKIVDHIKKWDPQCRLATFKAAGPNTSGEQLVAICRRQLERTGSDFVFGNVIGALQLTATVVDEFGAESFDSREAAIQNLCARLLSL